MVQAKAFYNIYFNNKQYKIVRINEFLKWVGLPKSKIDACGLFHHSSLTCTASQVSLKGKKRSYLSVRMVMGRACKGAWRRTHSQGFTPTAKHQPCHRRLLRLFTAAVTVPAAGMMEPSPVSAVPSYQSLGYVSRRAVIWKWRQHAIPSIFLVFLSLVLFLSLSSSALLCFNSLFSYLPRSLLIAISWSSPFLVLWFHPLIATYYTSV